MSQVCVTDDIRLFPAYDEPTAEELPMFAEHRVHQRSSGNPYPNRVVMRVDREHRSEKPFRVITLENEFLRIELMPELGGRIYSAMDKRTGYDFFYKQHVIKPALIGLLGSWISGGCEFNWPCHHRPSTFMPVDVQIEKHPDGAVTVWMSENEPLDRMKGMVGIHLAPGEARFDTRMKVYNRTATRHSFLWWENAAVPVNEQYRLVFPPDVHYVQFHYRKNVTSYPVASGVYNGIRMGQGTDISYHKNTHQPTSFFCANTDYDFFGGYDEGKRAGVIHVADHTVSVGKKMFTWAYNQLSRSWEKALTDTDGAYAELMASSYSLNQPDFAWLMPYECKEFSQMWYPVGGIGTPICACAEAVFAMADGKLQAQVTIPMEGATLTVNGNEVPFTLDPTGQFALDMEEALDSFVLKAANGRTLLSYKKAEPSAPEMPATIPDNPTLDQAKSAQELYMLGVHAEQYRDPAIRPAAYWRAAIRRDHEYVPALTALANDELNHYRVDEAYQLAMRAWRKITVRNFHPESGELQYLLGRIHEAQGKDKEAWDWYMQSAWAQDTRSRALTRAAMIEGRRGDHQSMLHLAEQALMEHTRNLTAQAIRVVALRHLKDERAEEALCSLLAFDMLDPLARALKQGAVNAFYASLCADARQTVLDIAQDLRDMGEAAFAAELLEKLPEKCAQTEYVRYYLTGDKTALQQAAQLSVGAAYPCRMIEFEALQAAVHENPLDTNAMNLWACQLYAAGNYVKAADLWQKALAITPDQYMLLRNLAVAKYSHLQDREGALALLDRAISLRPDDGQLIWEKALVMARLRCDPKAIAAFLEEKDCKREDCIIELCQAYNMAGDYQKTLDLMKRTNFTPCEGGEHAVADQYMFAYHALGRQALKAGQTEKALECFRNAQVLPDNLGAGLWNEVRLVPHQYYEAVCLRELGQHEAANALLDHILLLKQDYFSNLNLPELPCWQAMALFMQGRRSPAEELLASHLRAQEDAAYAVDAGYKKTTPFFISYMEDASVLRKGDVLWQKAMVHFAAGDTTGAASLAAQSLACEPINLYAHLL